jgi:DNA-binding NtrC family response regulator
VKNTVPDVKKTILLIDDDQSILRVFTRVFEKKGYAVVVAENGKDAIEKINHNHFDAALIDVRLPDMEGTDLIPIIQKTSPDAVKIIFTGSPTVELAGGLNNGLDAFLVKPVNPAIVLEIFDEKFKKE